MMKKFLLLFAMFFMFLFASTANSTVLYSEDFDSSDGGYTHSGTNDDWEWSSVNGAWGTGWGERYSNDSNQILQSVVFGLDIDTTKPITFSFDYAYRTAAQNDSVTLEYTTNGGSSWTVLNTYSGISQPPTWQNFSIDISGYYDTSFQAGWRLFSDAEDTEFGAYIDNVQIDGELNANAPVPEPATMLLFGLGLLGVAGVSRRRN